MDKFIHRSGISVRNRNESASYRSTLISGFVVIGMVPAVSGCGFYNGLQVRLIANLSS
ncbi:hypothetical protein BDN72DRAFT_846008 [Pluteus cervinus]|uniref:Uncharacterized protein n=1 Tax=Pluteus cervinus TaxID=181527 RepID=A0ACD3AI11_9AGAR|nr:hypothetical protein BDN72DRAFT_846008 [Pluteus cervinus]